MSFGSLPRFLQALESEGGLRRISAEVDPELEITEIVHELYRRSPETPVLLFENVRGSSFPLLINLLGSEKNIARLLGAPPEAAGEGILEAVQGLQRSAARGGILRWIWRYRRFLGRARQARPRRVRSAPCKEVVKAGSQVNLFEFPIMKCWPQDGGKFITAGLVATKSPLTGDRNLGIYRLQVFDERTLGLHWQIEKGGGFHFQEAESRREPLEVAVVIGGDPLIWFGGILPLPEGMDEISFAGLLSGRSVPMVRCQTLDLEVPAGAEIVIEGIARPGVRRVEGPFGDHFGHYSQAFPFPVLEVRCVTHRRGAVYHSAVVGKPPQEDKAMGEAVAKIFLPLVRLTRPELVDLWPYYEAGFHNLLVASMRQRYGKEAIKTALGLLGQGQLSLSKCVIVTDPEVNVRDFRSVLRAVRENFDPREDFILLPQTAQDTLDFTGPRLNHGSKMVLDATRKGRPRGETRLAGLEAGRPLSPSREVSARDFKMEDPRVRAARVLEETLLAVQLSESHPAEGRALLQDLLKMKEWEAFKIVAVVSPDVPLGDDVLLIWGIFCRFDCERDVIFTKTELSGARAVCEGTLGIDASWKKGYPEPLEMPAEVREKVKRRWPEYGMGELS